MFVWRVQVQIIECQGISYHPNAKYSLLIRMGDQFSPATPSVEPKDSHQTRIPFDNTLSLSLKSVTPQLPNKEVKRSIIQLQIILVMITMSKNNKEDNLEQIIGISTVNIQHPLQEYLQKANIFKFDKSLDTRGSVKAKITLSFQERSPESQSSRQRKSKSLKSLSLLRNSSFQSELSSVGTPRDSKKQDKAAKARDRYKQMIESLTSERNQLYKISNELYSELKKVTDERDEYMMELRQKTLVQQQTKAQLEFLKLKVFQYEQAHNMQHGQLLQIKNQSLEQHIKQLKDANQYLEATLLDKQKVIRELQRQVKESLVALNDFKQQAIEARSELIHKESQLSIIQTRTLDPAESIQQLLKQLSDRQYEKPLKLIEVQKEYPIQQLLECLKREINSIFVKIFSKMRTNKDKEWLMHEKGKFERTMEEKILIFSIQQ